MSSLIILSSRACICSCNVIANYRASSLSGINSEGNLPRALPVSDGVGENRDRKAENTDEKGVRRMKDGVGRDLDSRRFNWLIISILSFDGELRRASRFRRKSEVDDRHYSCLFELVDVNDAFQPLHLLAQTRRSRHGVV